MRLCLVLWGRKPPGTAAHSCGAWRADAGRQPQPDQLEESRLLKTGGPDIGPSQTLLPILVTLSPHARHPRLKIAR